MPVEGYQLPLDLQEFGMLWNNFSRILFDDARFSLQKRVVERNKPWLMIDGCRVQQCTSGGNRSQQMSMNRRRGNKGLDPSMKLSTTRMNCVLRNDMTGVRWIRSVGMTMAKVGRVRALA